MGIWEQFFEAYWFFARWMLAAIVVIFLLMMVVMRRPGKAVTILLLGGYITLTIHFLAWYDRLGFSMETALGFTIGAGLILCAFFYYFFFIRIE